MRGATNCHISTILWSPYRHLVIIVPDEDGGCHRNIWFWKKTCFLHPWCVLIQLPRRGFEHRTYGLENDDSIATRAQGIASLFAQAGLPSICTQWHSVYMHVHYWWCIYFMCSIVQLCVSNGGNNFYSLSMIYVTLSLLMFTLHSSPMISNFSLTKFPFLLSLCLSMCIHRFSKILWIVYSRGLNCGNSLFLYLNALFFLFPILNLLNLVSILLAIWTFLKLSHVQT